MQRRPPRSTRTDTLFPYTTLFRSAVPETWYKRMLAIAYDAKRMDLAVPASLDLVSAYPSADNWRDSLIIFRDTGKLDDQATLDLMRLMRAAGAMKGEADYYEYAKIGRAHV